MSQSNPDDMSDEELVRQLRLEYPHINWSVECREEAPLLPSPHPTEPATTSSAAATSASSPTSSDDHHSAACANCVCACEAEQPLERTHNTPPAATSPPNPATTSTPAPPEFIYPAPPGSNFTQLPPHARDFFTYLPGTVSPAVYREMLRYVRSLIPPLHLDLPSPDVAAPPPTLTSHSVMPPEVAARAAETRAAFERFRMDPQAPAFLRHTHAHALGRDGEEDEFEEVVDEVWGELMTVPWGYRRTQTGSRRRRPQRWRPLRAVEGKEGEEEEAGEEMMEDKKEEKRGRKRKMVRSGP